MLLQRRKKTNGEIALPLIPRSDSYSFVELFAAVCLAFISFFVMLYFGNGIWKLLETKLWYPSPKTLTAVIGAGVFVVMLLFFLLINIPALDRLIIPKKIKEARVYARALKHFEAAKFFCSFFTERELIILQLSGVISLNSML
ncbi:putative membrane protein [Treponema putidum]|nr:hypothetical protein [Treponema putidum]TWI77028.1 putative membrane protein [Treponema putidum]